jgi:hypothetical protein
LLGSFKENTGFYQTSAAILPRWIACWFLDCTPWYHLYGCAFGGPTQQLWSWCTKPSKFLITRPRKVIKTIPLGHFRPTKINPKTWQPISSPSWNKLFTHKSPHKARDSQHQGYSNPVPLHSALPGWHWAGFDSLCGSHGHTVIWFPVPRLLSAWTYIPPLTLNVLAKMGPTKNMASYLHARTMHVPSRPAYLAGYSHVTSHPNELSIDHNSHMQGYFSHMTIRKVTTSLHASNPHVYVTTNMLTPEGLIFNDRERPSTWPYIIEETRV